MSIVLKPLKPLSKTGKLLTSGDGAVHKGYTIPAMYVADYLEQCLVTLIWYGKSCPQDKVHQCELGIYAFSQPKEHWEP